MIDKGLFCCCVVTKIGNVDVVADMVIVEQSCCIRSCLYSLRLGTCSCLCSLLRVLDYGIQNSACFDHEFDEFVQYSQYCGADSLNSFNAYKNHFIYYAM